MCTTTVVLNNDETGLRFQCVFDDFLFFYFNVLACIHTCNNTAHITLNELPLTTSPQTYHITTTKEVIPAVDSSIILSSWRDNDELNYNAGIVML